MSRNVRRGLVAVLFASLPLLAAPPRAVPNGEAHDVWQAEAAAVSGAWQRVEDSQAGCGAYLDAAKITGQERLDFAFDLDRPATIRVRPIWWRTGDQTTATRVPYPFEAQTGPTEVVACGAYVFCSAPAAGRVLVVDLRTEAVVRAIEIGGYVTSLAAAPDQKLVAAADGAGSRVVLIDADKLTVAREVPCPAQPWSLASAGPRLYVACRAARQVVALELPSGRQVAERALDGEPVHVEVTADGTSAVVVRFVPVVLHALTSEPLAADQPSYGGGRRRRNERVGQQTIDLPTTGVMRFRQSGQAQELRLDAVLGDAKLPAGLPETLRDLGNPDALAIAAGRAFFTAPAAGRVGVVDIASRKIVRTIDVGGLPADLAAVGERVYVANFSRRQIQVIDARKLEVVRTVACEQAPVALAGVKSVALQRPYMVPPHEANKLFVLTDGTALTVIDTTRDTVVRTQNLPRAGRSLREVPVLTPDWWGVLPFDRIQLRETPKVAVELLPARLPSDLSAVATAAVSNALPLRTKAEAAVTGADGRAATKVFETGQPLLLKVDGNRWVDLSTLADPQVTPAPPLRPGEQPGAITFSVDDGAASDWQRGIYMAPDTMRFLNTATPAFWRYNAASFKLPAGRHVLRVNGHRPHARLDAVEVWRDLGADLKVDLQPLPRAVHEGVRLNGYRGVFYDAEPVKFAVSLTNSAACEQTVQFSWTVANYMNEPLASGCQEVSVAAGRTATWPLDLDLPGSGRYHLVTTLTSADGSATSTHDFVRLPKLEHPRLLFRRADLPQIKARMAEYPRLYQRYGQWLRQELAKTGERFPDRFLPNSSVAEELQQTAPPKAQQHTWRNYELGWRMVAVQFAALTMGDPDGLFERSMKPLMDQTRISGYCMYHHHGPFFPGATTAAWDLASDKVRQDSPLTAVWAKAKGNMDTMPWMLAAFEEPMSANDRALVYKLMAWENNAEAYFSTHMADRMGRLWQNAWTGCHCPNHGLLLSFVYLRSFFGEPRLHEKPMFRAYFTFQRYVEPLREKTAMLPANRGPLGEPARWISASLSRNPLEKSLYPWSDWVRQANCAAASDEAKAVDELFNLKGWPLTGPMGGCVNHFVSAAALPIALATGWFDPDAPEVKRAESPPTALSGHDGWVPMRSDWGGLATEVNFMCGPREHTSRERPGHITINRAGAWLLGTPALWGDDGNNTPSWGNTIVVDNDWQANWQDNLVHPRDGEHFVVNRFSRVNWDYLFRDRVLTGFAPAEGGWGGGLDLHGHTQTAFMREGQVIAYQTRPAFDYVAGDASNTWPLAKLTSHLRQVVFVRPNLLVVYDRVQLGEQGQVARWQAATGAEATVDGARFRVERDGSALDGLALLPRDAAVATPPNFGAWQWRFQRLLTITPRSPQAAQEFLVVLRTGSDLQTRPIPAQLVERGGRVGVALANGAEVLFDRAGTVGGSVKLNCEAVELPRGVQDTYRYWRSDPRYRAWMSEPRFRFVVTEAAGR